MVRPPAKDAAKRVRSVPASKTPLSRRAKRGVSASRAGAVARNAVRPDVTSRDHRKPRSRKDSGHRATMLRRKPRTAHLNSLSSPGRASLAKGVADVGAGGAIVTNTGKARHSAQRRLLRYQKRPQTITPPRMRCR